MHLSCSRRPSKHTWSPCTCHPASTIVYLLKRCHRQPLIYAHTKTGGSAWPLFPCAAARAGARHLPSTRGMWRTGCSPCSVPLADRQPPPPGRPAAAPPRLQRATLRCLPGPRCRLTRLPTTGTPGVLLMPASSTRTGAVTPHRPPAWHPPAGLPCSAPLQGAQSQHSPSKAGTASPKALAAGSGPVGSPLAAQVCLPAPPGRAVRYRWHGG